MRHAVARIGDLPMTGSKGRNLEIVERLPVVIIYIFLRSLNMGAMGIGIADEKEERLIVVAVLFPLLEKLN